MRVCVHIGTGMNQGRVKSVCMGCGGYSRDEVKVDKPKEVFCLSDKVCGILSVCAIVKCVKDLYLYIRVFPLTKKYFFDFRSYFLFILGLLCF